MALNNIFSVCVSGINRNCRGTEIGTSLRYTEHALDFCSFLFRRGWISGFSITNKTTFNKVIDINYKMYNNRNAIYKIQLVSTPGNRSFYTYKRLHKFCYNYKNSNYVLSTSKGFLSETEALSLNIGGEIIARIIE
jgi:small subunit ribosomal protein S8